MAKQFESIGDDHRKFIDAQHIFFTATAAPDGLVNLSPKGMDSLRVLGPNRIVWLNQTGSGNETAAHLLEADRMTIMWCSFTKRPSIMRAYGTARTLHPRDNEFNDLAALFDAGYATRQIYDVNVDTLQISCGFGVPFFDHIGSRDTLTKWAQDRGPEGIKAYWKDRNQTSFDGRPTGILETVNET